MGPLEVWDSDTGEGVTGRQTGVDGLYTREFRVYGIVGAKQGIVEGLFPAGSGTDPYPNLVSATN